MDNYEKNKREKLAEGLADFFMQPVINKAMKKMKSRTDNDPALKQDLDNLKSSTDKLLATLTRLCKKNPGSDYCSDLAALKNKLK